MNCKTSDLAMIWESFFKMAWGNTASNIPKHCRERKLSRPQFWFHVVFTIKYIQFWFFCSLKEHFLRGLCFPWMFFIQGKFSHFCRSKPFPLTSNQRFAYLNFHGQQTVGSMDLFVVEKSFSLFSQDIFMIFILCAYVCMEGASVVWGFCGWVLLVGFDLGCLVLWFFFFFPWIVYMVVRPEELLTSKRSETLQRSPDFLALQSTACLRGASTQCESGLRRHPENW